MSLFMVRNYKKLGDLPFLFMTLPLMHCYSPPSYIVTGSHVAASLCLSPTDDLLFSGSCLSWQRFNNVTEIRVYTKVLQLSCAPHNMYLWYSTEIGQEKCGSNTVVLNNVHSLQYSQISNVQCGVIFTSFPKNQKKYVNTCMFPLTTITHL